MKRESIELGIGIAVTGLIAWAIHISSVKDAPQGIDTAAFRLDTGAIGASLAPPFDIACRPREAVFQKPAGATGFIPSMGYPTTLPGPGEMSGEWNKINPTDSNRWREYLYAVLKYAYEGNLEVDFDVTRNPVRRWYHAPWMHRKLKTEPRNKAEKMGFGGREWVHGLTQERYAPFKELSIDSKSSTLTKNWGISMYNEIGGYTLGQIWDRVCRDDLNTAIMFSPGTIAFKLIFTSATDKEVKYLEGSPTWAANIHPSIPEDTTRLRLIQIDLMVRDTKVDHTTGWVFGTFVVDGRRGMAPELHGLATGSTMDTGWLCVYPVGIAWGNDPVQAKNEKAPLVEQFIDTNIQGMIRRQMGWRGRLNGPVDNPNASCVSCHAQSQYTLNPAKQAPSPTALFTNNASDKELVRYFAKNLKPHQAFDNGYISLDYSLQLLSGMASYWNAQRIHGTTEMRRRAGLHPALNPIMR